VSAQFANRCDILWLFRIRAQGEVVRNPPQAHLSIVTSTGKNVVVERVPVVVQHGGGVSSEQRHGIGHLSTLLQRDDGECAASGRLPVDGQVLGVTFHQVGVPGVLANAEVVIAGLALASLSEDMSWRWRGQDAIIVGVMRMVLRYLEALTKRPDIAAREEEGLRYREVGLVYLYNQVCSSQKGRGDVVVVMVL
jgi:hypothetical protein